MQMTCLLKTMVNKNNMECGYMNYYFTGGIIIAFVLLTFLVAPL